MKLPGPHPASPPSAHVANATTVVLGTTTRGQGSHHLVMIRPFAEGDRQAEAMENWFQACASDQSFALELSGTQREQLLCLRASSEEQLTSLSKQFEAQYPQADLQRIAPTGDPLFLRAGEHAVVGTFKLTQDAWMPLKTFPRKALAEAGGDPLVGILAAMEPLAPGERLIAQLALVRAPETWINRFIRKSVEHPLQAERDRAAAGRSGQATSDTAEGMKVLLGMVGAFVALFGYRWYQQHNWHALIALAAVLIVAVLSLFVWWIKRKPGPMYDRELVAQKLMRAAFYCHLRVIAIGQQSSSTEQHLQAHVARMEVAYRQFTLASANGLALEHSVAFSSSSKKAARLADPAAAFPYAHPALRFFHGAPTKDVWNSLELSGAFHLPQELADVPLVRRLAVKRLLFPPELSHQVARITTPMPPACIGYSRQRGYQVPVLLPYDALFSHKFLVARSRYGKSTLMQLLLAAGMKETTPGTLQPGIFVIDPHRDLIMDALMLIPPERAKDVLLLDMTDAAFPIALNPLDASMGFTCDQATGNFMSSCKQIWQETWGPRMEHFLKNVFLLLYTLNEELVKAGRADEQYTLLDINPMLQYKTYAIKVLHQLNMKESWHQELLSWWQNVYFMLPSNSSFRQEIIMPIITKMATFHDNVQVRRIVGQPITRAPIHEVVSKGKIVLCALSSRDMDETSVNILGATLINLLRRSFRLQEHVPLTERRKIFVAIDEFQAFSGADFGKLLSEDAKYGCAALLATQYLKQLNKVKEGLLETVLGNCEQVFAFNVSASDAELLAAELQEKMTPTHILSQPRLHCYARLALLGSSLQVASVELARPPSWQRTPQMQAQVQMIREANRRRFQSASAVDQHYEQHLRQFLDVETFYKHNIEREVQKMAASAKRAAASSPPAQSASGSANTPPPMQPTQKQTQADASGAPAGLRTASAVDQQGSSTPAPEAAGSSPQAVGDVSPVGQPTGKRKRSHVRSRRAKRIHQHTAPTNALAQQTNPSAVLTDAVLPGDGPHPRSDVFGRAHSGGGEWRERGERG